MQVCCSLVLSSVQENENIIHSRQQRNADVRLKLSGLNGLVDGQDHLSGDRGVRLRLIDFALPAVHIEGQVYFPIQKTNDPE